MKKPHLLRILLILEETHEEARDGVTGGLVRVAVDARGDAGERLHTFLQMKKKLTMERNSFSRSRFKLVS